MERIAPDTHIIDVRHLGLSRVIAASVITCPTGIAVVDPGPTSTLPHLWEGLDAAGWSPDDLIAVLLTHVHLDHAGATGSIVQSHPAVPVYVHERGAKHVVDPSRLVDSATRIFGDDMSRLWGECRPVPAANVRTLGERDTLSIGGRPLLAAYTPGHAWHHVSYFDEATGVAFVGDATGARVGDAPVVVPTTPPPDIDVATIHASMQRIREWGPETLLLTHFGPAADPSEHFDLAARAVDAWADRVRQGIETAAGDGDDAMAQAFAAEVLRDLRAQVGEPIAAVYEVGASPSMSWYGLARYWRKVAAGEDPARSRR